MLANHGYPLPKPISGPPLDRIDIHIKVLRVEYEKLTDDRLGEPSADVRTRVEKARRSQRERIASARGGSMLVSPCCAMPKRLPVQRRCADRPGYASTAG